MTIDVRSRDVSLLFSESGDLPDPPFLERRRQRAALFREPLAFRMIRLAAEVAAALDPRRLLDRRFDGDDAPVLVAGLPDPAEAGADGFCGLAEDLSPGALMEAYARGLEPRTSLWGPAWWSPAQRLAVVPREADIPKAVRGHLRRRDLTVTFDTAFDTVLARSAGRRRRAGAMSPRLLEAYAALHDAGFAHSFEVRDASGALIAGGFGVALGRVFVTEGTFGRVDHWVDYGLVVLNRHLARWGTQVHVFEAGAPSRRFGFAPVERLAYGRMILGLLGGGRMGLWRADPALTEPGLPAPAAESLLAAAGLAVA